MLRLTVLRHAHASDAPPGGEDFDRPLSAHGRAIARNLGSKLGAALPAPQRLRVSNARRTRETAKLVCGAAWPDVAIDFASTLYAASLDALLREIAATTPDCAHLALVGHNPGLSELWSLLGDETQFRGLAPCEWRSREFDAESWTDVTRR